ncbi:hypothetical protein OV203_01285 [Nannocystis sp. ILAH1]|uniref:hypothetical protein n=1 Tax=unclassified Nannocystis TaxID=2627009 RepID=UPI00226EDECB|nr:MULTISPECIES: hypothetical protein [unclassified Nannocystis]MCY0985743.1 hypothetical protein [Nannocystis sp. ILAH1]MCY1068425.1 hypothetical protein [Nannocystis sp. RBIL2]
MPKGAYVEYRLGLSEEYGGDGGKVRALLYDGTFQTPEVLDGRSYKASGWKPHEWYGWVAYRKAYPAGPLLPESGSEWAAALARARACVEALLLSD